MKQQINKSPTQRRLVVYGNLHAAAIAAILKQLRPLTDRFSIDYADSATTSRESIRNCEVLFDQCSHDKCKTLSPPMVSKRVRFPMLNFELLWPFHSANPYNRPAPPDFPFGPFPHGDSFLLACLEQGVSRADALKLYSTPTWSPSWPDLDGLFLRESARLTAIDARSDIQIGSYILKHFRKKRLFLAPFSPSDLLLCELITRLLAAGFPQEEDIVDADVPGVFVNLGWGDYLGSFALPIHPLVAKHFQLTWFDPNARHNYFDREQLTAHTYYERFWENALAQGGGSTGVAERIKAR